MIQLVQPPEGDKEAAQMEDEGSRQHVPDVYPNFAELDDADFKVLGCSVCTCSSPDCPLCQKPQEVAGSDESSDHVPFRRDEAAVGDDDSSAERLRDSCPVDPQKGKNKGQRAEAIAKRCKKKQGPPTPLGNN